MMKSGKFRHFLGLSALGFLSGVINGLFGCGGGIIAVAAFSGALSEERNRKKRTQEAFSMTVCSVAAMSLAAAFVYRTFGAINSVSIAEYLLPALGGGAIGAVLLGKINTRVLKKIFAALIIYSGIKMIIG